MISCLGELTMLAVTDSFFPPTFPPLEGEGGMKLIPKSDSVLHFFFLVFSYRHFESNQVSTQFFVRMGVREHLPIARDRFLN